MKTLTKEMQCRIRRWIERNARPLEWALYRQKFENGSESAVLEALSAYQNPDGGFGYALEPDDWNQNSTLNATLYAMQLMLNIGVTQHPLMEGALRFLRSEACFQNGEWQFCTPSSRDYPHAPWWGMTEDEAKEENAGVSNKVAGLSRKTAFIRQPSRWPSAAFRNSCRNRQRGKMALQDMHCCFRTGSSLVLPQNQKRPSSGCWK